MKKCCKKKENLVLQPGKPGSELCKCKKCGSNHRKLIAEPGIFGIIGKNLGENNGK